MNKRPTYRIDLTPKPAEQKCISQLDVTEVRKASRRVAETFYGPRGLWVVDCYDAINRQLYDNELPPALVTIELTAHGKCLGQTHPNPSRPPIVRLHPSTFGGTELDNPWKVPPEWLGWRYALDVLIHETIHVSVAYLLGGPSGPTSHNCPKWRSEVERIAPFIGLRGFTASMSKSKRVETGEYNEKGKPIKKVARVTVGEFPYVATFCFPHAARGAMDTTDYYIKGEPDLDVPEYGNT